jgi:hypothetical protein
LEKKRYEVSEEDIKRHFEALTIHFQKVPSLFVWNADEMRRGKPKKQEAPDVIVSAIMKTETVTIAEERDDSQLTVPTAISAFGDSIPPLVITRNKIFEPGRLEREQLYHGHDYFIRNTQKTFITEVLFLDWLQTQFIPKNEELRAEMKYKWSVSLLVDAVASHIPPRVIAYAGSQKLVLVKLIAHSLHIGQPLDLCVFGLFNVFIKRNQKQTNEKVTY